MGSLYIYINSDRYSRLSGGRPCIAITYNLHGEVARMAKNRGLAPTRAGRYASEEEVQTESHPHRAGFITYSSWRQFIEDERKWCNDPRWFERIEELRKEWPQFDTNQMELAEG